MLVCVSYNAVFVTSTISSRTAKISSPLFALSNRNSAKVCDTGRTEFAILSVSNCVGVFPIHYKDSLDASVIITQRQIYVLNVTINRLILFNL